VDPYVNMTSDKRQHCDGRTSAVFRWDAHRKRRVDRNYRLCMKCVDQGRDQQNRDLNATINIFRQLATKLYEYERPAHSKP